MVVIYAEKPSVGRTIASALGGSTFDKSQEKQGYFIIMYRGLEHAVTWGVGHLCALAEAAQYNPDYKNWRNLPSPFIPDDYKIVLNEKGRDIKTTYRTVKKLFDQADWIINATDFDREGELIFYYLYQYSGCTKPVMRANLASMEDEGIRQTFDSLMKSSDFAGLLASARCRSIADWVVGCNLTVAMTLAAGSQNICSIGRVQTPTLAMVVARDEEIANFKPEDYFTVEAKFTKANGEYYKAVHKEKRFKTRNEAEAVLARCCSSRGTVTDIETKESFRNVPGLYDLNLLQMAANGKYGMSLNTTLAVTQKLYEKGLVTYPRTDCHFLPEDMKDKILNVQEMLRNNGFGHLFNADADPRNMSVNPKRFFDDSKLGSHFAIVPTERAASGLDPDEQKVYGLIADSVIRMLYPPAKVASTTIITAAGNDEFVSNGNMVLEKGWLFVNGELKEELLPDLTEGEQVSGEYAVEAKKTKPPAHYTDKTLLAAMMSAGKILEEDELRTFMDQHKIEGIGTTATRAPIIETLLGRGYIVRDKKKILATQRGINLIHTIPVEDIKSAVMTAKYEKQLDMIVNGQETPEHFLDGIYRDLTQWCNEIRAMPVREKLGEKPSTDLMCPSCGAPLVKFSWGYGCSEHNNGCKFSIGKIAGKMLTEKQVKELLSQEKIGPLDGFKKKDGGSFSASLKLVAEEDGTYKIAFDFPGPKADEEKDLYSTCPDCGAKIIKGRWGWECSAHCGISVPYELCKRKIEPKVAESLLAAGSTPILEGFISKKGKPFNASLTFEDKKVKFVFPNRG